MYIYIISIKDKRIQWLCPLLPIPYVFFFAKYGQYAGFLSHRDTPQSSCILDGIFHETNHPAIGGVSL